MKAETGTGRCPQTCYGFDRTDVAGAFPTRDRGKACILFPSPVITLYMARVFTMRNPIAVRALFTLGALISLCVSDTVGPRLLPLPASATRAAAVPQAVEGASRAPLGNTSQVVRVAMAAPTPKQEGAGRHSLHLIPHADVELVTPPCVARTFLQTTSTPSPAASAAVTRPPGRAPPPSV